MRRMILFMTAALTFSAAGTPLPSRPTDPAHPGSDSFEYTLFRERIQIDGRAVDFFAPAESTNASRKAPVIVFGHGQALNTEHYEQTFEHLAKKGFAVIAPTYDQGFFDRDWRRMASDYSSLTAKTLQRYANYVDAGAVVFSGHSKGAYIGLMAAGVPTSIRLVAPSALVLFAPAGFDEEYLRAVDPAIPVTIVYGDRDKVIAADLINQIYAGLPSIHKQLITVASFTSTTPTLEADHYFVMSKAFFMGGRDGLSPFHFYGTFKWLIGAAQDIEAKSPVSNDFIYGAQTGSTGLPGLESDVRRSW